MMIAARPVPLTHAAMSSHLPPLRPMRSASVPASAPWERTAIAMPTPAEPALADSAAPQPIRATIEPTAVTRRIVVRQVGSQRDALLDAAEDERIVGDRAASLRVSIPGMNHRVAGRRIGENFRVAGPPVERHEVAAIRAGRGRAICEKIKTPGAITAPITVPMRYFLIFGFLRSLDGLRSPNQGWRHSRPQPANSSSASTGPQLPAA